MWRKFINVLPGLWCCKILPRSRGESLQKDDLCRHILEHKSLGSGFHRDDAPKVPEGLFLLFTEELFSELPAHPLLRGESFLPR